MPLNSPPPDVRKYLIGDTATAMCVINHSTNPSVLPITAAGVWISLRKESTRLWLNFSSGLFDGVDYSPSAYKASMSVHSDGVYTYGFTPAGANPDGYLAVYTTDYDFGYPYDPPTEILYFYIP